MIAEYNTLAKKYNATELDMKLVKQVDLRRMEQVYRNMTPAQRKSAEPLPPLVASPRVQDIATKAQVKEYNTLAKKYNTMSKDNFRILVKEANQITHLYSLMTEQQKESAQPFPDFPPPPSSPKVTKHIKSNIPPPPPPVLPVIHKGEIKEVPPLPLSPSPVQGEIKEVPPPPPSPKSPEEHMIEMAEKDAVFYFDGKKISSDKAIKILKESKKISVLTRHEGLERPIVELSVSPLVIEPQ
jgi:hypothetical protein